MLNSIRLLLVFCLYSSLALAQKCSGEPLNLGETLFPQFPLVSDFDIEGTGSSFTITWDPDTKKDTIVIHHSNGSNTNVNANSVQAFLDAACPGEFPPGSYIKPGTFSPRATSPTAAAGLAALGVGAGDFNGDGVSDSAIVYRTGVSVYLSGPDGAVRAPVSYNVNSSTEQGIVVADFNGDGKPDIAVLVDGSPASNPGSVAIFFGVGDGTFKPAVYVSLGETPIMIAAGDINGDSKPDLLVYGGISGKGNYAVLLGKGDGTFAAPVNSPDNSPNRPFSLLVADMNGDGKGDLVAAGGDQLWVMPGKSDGTLGTPIFSTTGGSSPYLAYADLNHDGKIDILIGDATLSAFIVLNGNGDGTLQPAKYYVAPSKMQSMVVIPLNDGNTAIVIPDRLAGALVFAFANAQGKVALPPLVFTPTTNIGYPTVLSADLNGDKKPDLVMASAGGLFVQLNNGNGVFAPPVTIPGGTNSTGVAIGDFNKDGKLDVVLGGTNGASLLLGKGDGTFNSPTVVMPGKLGAVTIADFNNDQKLDIAASTTTGGFVILLGKGDGTFLAPLSTVLASGAGQTGTILSSDFNNDGKPDLIVQYLATQFSGGTVVFLAGKGDGTFASPQTIVAPASDFDFPVTFAAGDLNGDGKPDLAVYMGNSDRRIGTLLGNGNGTFQPPVFVSINEAPLGMAIADLNGDGKPDLLASACCGLAEASYLLGNGDGTLQSETYFLSGPGPTSFAIGDFTGRGRADVAVAGYAGIGNSGYGTLAVLANNFPKAAAPLAVVSSANSKATAVAPGSLAGAFGTDLASANLSATTVAVNDSAGVTTAAQLLYVSPTQVNFFIPSSVSLGPATVTATSGDGTISTGAVTIAAVAPGLFTFNASGLAAAGATLVSGNTQTPEAVYTVAADGTIVANPINLGGPGDFVVLILYGTGLQAAGTAGVSATIAGVPATVQYAGPQGAFLGLDQINVVVPAQLAGAGQVQIQLTANNLPANPVNVAIH